MGRMTFRKYIAYCMISAVLWAAVYLSSGYFLGLAFKDDIDM